MQQLWSPTALCVVHSSFASTHNGSTHNGTNPDPDSVWGPIKPNRGGFVGRGVPLEETHDNRPTTSPQLFVRINDARRTQARGTTSAPHIPHNACPSVKLALSLFLFYGPNGSGAPPSSRTIGSPTLSGSGFEPLRVEPLWVETKGE